jgi:Mlc titration factor MtfA (ptsG expression regulator)
LNYLAFIAFTLFALAIVGTIVVNTYQVVSAVFRYFLKDFVNRHLIFRRLHPEAKAFLQLNFKYYQRLSDREKLLFERRTQKFIKTKYFVPRGGLKEVTLEMKTLVAASAIQITFGFPSIYFEHFYTILIYPEHYQSTLTGKLHEGEVHTGGYIVLSWKHLLQGYSVDNDGRNLGLHEMAHALKIVDSIQSREYDFMDTALLHRFILLAREEMQRISAGEDSFFRAYAATNDQEFFAVAVENFFERSLQFQQYHPELFEMLGDLLNQKSLIESQMAAVS